MRKRTSTEQSYEPLVTPESWKGDELRFSVRLTQILDGLFARLRAMRAELADKLGKTEQAADSAKLGGVSAGSFALKTDTAPNAEKLGGKMPEYYLTPVNLLCNGDFLNPTKPFIPANYNVMGLRDKKGQITPEQCPPRDRRLTVLQGNKKARFYVII